MIQTQVELLGSGTPSKAPDLRQLLRDEGIVKPEDQSTMIDKYSDHKDEVQKVTSGIHRKDDGIVVKTAGVGDVVTKAYGAIDTSVGELNAKIDASHNAVRTVTDKNGKPVTDENGNVQKELPRDIINGLFEGVWDTLNTTYTQVRSVSDKAAAEALNIRGDEPSFTNTNTNTNTNSGGAQPVSYPTSGYNGSTPWTPSSGSMGTAIIPSGEKPTAMAIMPSSSRGSTSGPQATADQPTACSSGDSGGTRACRSSPTGRARTSVTGEPISITWFRNCAAEAPTRRPKTSSTRTGATPVRWRRPSTGTTREAPDPRSTAAANTRLGC
jgi:hypothetical protein